MSDAVDDLLPQESAYQNGCYRPQDQGQLTDPLGFSVTCDLAGAFDVLSNAPAHIRIINTTTQGWAWFNIR
jgi:hypothetical protein